MHASPLQSSSMHPLALIRSSLASRCVQASAEQWAQIQKVLCMIDLGHDVTLPPIPRSWTEPPRVALAPPLAGDPLVPLGWMGGEAEFGWVEMPSLDGLCSDMEDEADGLSYSLVDTSGMASVGRSSIQCACDVLMAPMVEEALSTTPLDASYHGITMTARGLGKSRNVAKGDKARPKATQKQ